MSPGQIMLLAFVSVFVLVPLAFWLVPKAIRFVSCRRDHGRIVFAQVEKLLLTRSDDWQRRQGRFLSKTYTLESPAITITRESFMCLSRLDLEIGGAKLSPGGGWRDRISDAVDAMVAAQEKAKRLHAICDSIEALAESNVITLWPGRKSGTNNG